jgi:hypothetical protein
MRHGRKSQHQRFDGYKLHAAATTHGRAPDHRGRGGARERAGRTAGQGAGRPAAEGAAPERLLDDTAYGTGPVRAELRERKVEALAPVPEAPVREGRLAKRDFRDRPRGGHGHLPRRPRGEDPHPARRQPRRGLLKGHPSRLSAASSLPGSSEHLSRACNSPPRGVP